MTATIADLTYRLNADSDAVADAARALALAQDKVTAYVADHAELKGVEVGELAIPASALDEAVLRCATDLFNRAQAPNGVLMAAYGDNGSGSAAPLRAPRDAMANARRALTPWIPLTWGFV